MHELVLQILLATSHPLDSRTPTHTQVNRYKYPSSLLAFEVQTAQTPAKQEAQHAGVIHDNALTQPLDAASMKMPCFSSRQKEGRTLL